MVLWMLSFSNYWVDSHDPKFFKFSCSVEVWHYLRLLIGPIVRKSIQSIHLCMPPDCHTLRLKFCYRRGIWTNEHICSLEYFTSSNIFFSYFQFHSLWNLSKILYSFTMFHFCSWSCGMIAGERCLYNHPPGSLCTVRSRYIAVILLRITHERHHIAHPLGELWGVVREFKYDQSFVIESVMLCAISCYIQPRYIESL